MIEGDGAGVSALEVEGDELGVEVFPAGEVDTDVDNGSTEEAGLSGLVAETVGDASCPTGEVGNAAGDDGKSDEASDEDTTGDGIEASSDGSSVESGVDGYQSFVLDVANANMGNTNGSSCAASSELGGSSGCSFDVFTCKFSGARFLYFFN